MRNATEECFPLLKYFIISVSTLYRVVSTVG